MYLNKRIEAIKREVLRVTIDFLKHLPDAELRITDICEQAEMSQTIIYSYFDSREGLIDAAYLEIFNHQSEIISEISCELLSLDLTPPLKLSNFMNDKLINHFVQQGGSRELRIRIYARAVSRPVFARKIKEARERHYVHLLEKITTQFPDRKLFITNDAVLAAASVFDTLQTSRSLYEMIFDASSESNMLEIAVHALNVVDQAHR